MSQDNFTPRISAQTAQELQWFLDELAQNKEVTTEQALAFEWVSEQEQIMQDVIDHLIELRTILDNKIQLMEIRKKNIW